VHISDHNTNTNLQTSEFFCCIRRGPGGECIVNVVPEETEQIISG